MKSIQIKCYFAFFCLALFNASAVRAEQTDNDISSLFYTLESKLNRSIEIGAKFQNTFRLCQSADGYYGVVQNDENGLPGCFSLNHEGFVVSGNNNKPFKILTHTEILEQKIFERLSVLSRTAGLGISWGKKGFYYSEALLPNSSIFILTRPAPDKRAANKSQNRNTLGGYDDDTCTNCRAQHYESQRVQFLVGIGAVASGATVVLGVVAGVFCAYSWIRNRRQGLCTG